MAIDEVEAFKLAADEARSRGWEWRPPFFWYLEEGEWQVHAESERSIRINAITGEPKVEAEIKYLDPLAAFSIAKSYASEQGLSWKPSFSLELNQGHWSVGACQSQFGGQVHIQVSHQGEVVASSVNPK